MVLKLGNLADFKANVTDPKEKVIIDFTATWCGPCKSIGPKFEGLAADPKYSSIKFYKCDVDAAAEVAEAESINAMPTFKTYNNGAVVSNLVGADVNALKKILDELLTAE